MEGIGKTRAFLTEFIIVILFFSLAAVITLQLFLAADEKSKLSTVQTNAYLKMQMIAEEARGQGAYVDSLFSEANGWKNGTRYYTYNGDFVLCTEAEADYALKVQLTKEETEAGALSHISLEMCSMEQEQIGAVSVSVYEPEWRDAQ